MPAQENIEIMQRWFREVWNEGRIQTVYELFSPDGIATGHYGDKSQIRGPKEFVPFVEQIRGAFPDIRTDIEDAFATEDKVVVRWSASMTHTGQGFGQPTAKPVRVTGISIARIVDGQLVEGWDNWDRLAMLQQIDALQAA
jgi:steroid delta-isomerase-like uncharacterized protein